MNRSRIVSNSEFGASMMDRVTQPSSNLPDSPMGLGSATAGTVAQATAWKTRGVGRGAPLSYSKRTRGTTFSWDDDSTTPSFQQPS